MAWGVVFVVVAIGLIDSAILMIDDPASVGLGLEPVYSDGGYLLLLALTPLPFMAWPLIVARRLSFSAVDTFGLAWRGDGWFSAKVAAAALGANVAAGMAVSILLRPDVDDYWTVSGDGELPVHHWFALVTGVAVLTPIGEELFFRGLVLRAAAKRWSARTANIFQAGLFTLFHAGNATSVAASVGTMASVGAYGLVVGWATLRRGRLGPAIVAHMTLNGVVLAFEWMGA